MRFVKCQNLVNERRVVAKERKRTVAIRRHLSWDVVDAGGGYTINCGSCLVVEFRVCKLVDGE